MTYDSIRTLAFQFAPGVMLTQPVYTMALPENWKSIIREACAQQYGRSLDETTLPIYSLNQVLFALIPDISIAPYAGSKGAVHWLLGAQPIDPDAIRTILLYWLSAKLGNAPITKQQQLQMSLRVADLVCQAEHVNWAAWTRNEAATARETSVLAYDILPDLLARRLVERVDGIRIGDELLRFRRFPHRPGSRHLRGARVVSWPPLEHGTPSAKWFYSVYIDITVQTIPYVPLPQVFCHCGLTRWLSRPNSKIYAASGNSTNAAILTHSPLIAGAPRSTSFQTVSASRRRVNDEWQTLWDYELPYILRQLNVQERFPQPEAILALPEQHIRGVSGVCAAFVYRTELPDKHGVEAGLLVGDRRALNEQLVQVFEPELIPVCEPQRCGGRRDFAIQENHAHVQLAATFTQKQLTVEIYWRTRQIKQMLEQQLQACLGGTQEVGGFKIALRAHEQDGRFGNLDLEAAKLPHAIGTRVQAMMVSLNRPLENEVIAALVEIDDRRGQRDNAKQAIRIGLARTSRISQFIRSGEELLEHRARQACRDLLRQLGCRDALLSLQESLGVETVSCLGFWMVNQFEDKRAATKRYLFPIAIHHKSDGLEAKALAPGFTKWLPYPEALLAVAEGQCRTIKKEAVASFVQDVLHDFDGAGPTVIFATAQNFRSYWTWLQNGRIELDRFSVGDVRPLFPQDRPDLRIIRLRTSEGRETPEFYACNDEQAGLASGLFRLSERVFYSAASTPPTVKENRHTSKISSWQTRDGQLKEKRPATRGWNPNLLEITCAFLQARDDPAKWAQLAHTLRDLSVQYDSQTALPLPLHLAMGMEEYLPPTYSA